MAPEIPQGGRHRHALPYAQRPMVQRHDVQSGRNGCRRNLRRDGILTAGQSGQSGPSPKEVAPAPPQNTSAGLGRPASRSRGACRDGRRIIRTGFLVVSGSGPRLLMEHRAHLEWIWPVTFLMPRLGFGYLLFGNHKYGAYYP